MTDKTARKTTDATDSAQAPDATDAAPKRLRDLSVPELMTGAVASMFVAMLGSRLGTAGTLAGAAVASVGYAVINHVLTTGVDRTKHRLGAVGASLAVSSVALFGASMLFVTGTELGSGRSLDGRPGATSVGVERVSAVSAIASERTPTAQPTTSTEEPASSDAPQPSDTPQPQGTLQPQQTPPPSETPTAQPTDESATPTTAATPAQQTPSDTPAPSVTTTQAPASAPTAPTASARPTPDQSSALTKK